MIIMKLSWNTFFRVNRLYIITKSLTTTPTCAFNPSDWLGCTVMFTLMSPLPAVTGSDNNINEKEGKVPSKLPPFLYQCALCPLTSGLGWVTRGQLWRKYRGIWHSATESSASATYGWYRLFTALERNVRLYRKKDTSLYLESSHFSNSK